MSEIEIGKEVTDAIAAEVTKSLEADFKAKSDALEAKIAEIEKAAKDDVEKSKLKTGEDVQDTKSEFADMSKEKFLVEQIIAKAEKNTTRLVELNKYAIKTQFDAGTIDKATYMNTAVVADGGALVPSNDLLTDVFTTLSATSSIAADLRVVTLTNGNGIDVATLLQDVVVTEVGTEGGKKDTTKVTLGDGEVNVREFAGISIITRKLLRQAAMDVYSIVEGSFARAIQRKRGELALTDATSGLVNKSGVVSVEASGTALASYTWNDFKRLPYRVPVAAAAGGKYYISRQALEHLDTLQDSQGRDLDIVKADGATTGGTLKNGYAYSVEDSLGVGAVPHVVFGNASQYGILVRQAEVGFKLLEEGQVVDGSSVAHNLGQENKVAPRFEWHENIGWPIPGAFAKLVNKSGS